mgnify:FL=1
MEKITAKIKVLLEEKLSLFAQMNQLLVHERELILKMDVDALWKTMNEKKNLSEMILKTRQAILEAASEKGRLQDIRLETFSLSYLLREMPLEKTDKKILQQLKTTIETEKLALQNAALENKRYINEYLLVIDDIMAAVLDNSKLAQYNQAGSVPDRDTSNCLIRAEV